MITMPLEYILKYFLGTALLLGGAVLMLLSFLTSYKYLIQEKRCTAKVKGIVKGYTATGTGSSGVHLPVVRYTVDGKEYKAVGPNYKMVVTKSISTPFSKNSSTYKEEGQILHINRSTNSFVGTYKNPMAELYPLNSEIDVYYDPNNPKLSYVLRYCNNKWMFWLMFIAALTTWMSYILILILV